MRDNKLASKTRAVFNKQNELNNLIEELKTEVVSVYNDNQDLLEENEQLKKQLRTLASRLDGDVKKENSVTQVEEVKKVEETKEVPKPIKQVVEEQVVKKVKPRPVHQPNVIAEFFLGKNIIAKIAVVLIMLGVITFGQMAYDWLPDIGKTLLILFTGALFFGIGILFEKKDIFVFSNVFYAIGIAIVYYSFLLSTVTFNIMSTSVLSYVLIALLISMYYYFKERRYPFLDIVLFSYYLGFGVSILFYKESTVLFSTYLETILLTGFTGFMLYTYYSRYFKDNQKLKIISQVVFGVVILLISMWFNSVVNYNSLYHFQVILYTLFGIYGLYTINVFDYPEKESLNLMLNPIVSTINVLLLSIMFSNYVFSVTMLNHAGILLLCYIVIMIPLYTYIYLFKKEEYPSIANYYVTILAFFLLAYSFVANSISANSTLMFYQLNIILAIEVLCFFVLSKRTKDLYHRNISYIFMTVLILRNIAHYFQLSDFTFEQSDVLFVTLGLGVILLALNVYYRYKKQDTREMDLLFVNGYNLLALIPLFIIFTNDVLSSDYAYIMAMVMVLFVGYRWLMELRPFTMKNQKHFVLAINIVILWLTFGLNLIYFDHDFSTFTDVFKFLFMLTLNVYIIYTLKEVYYGYCITENEERNFVIIYGIGVLIHSYFIHRYINIEFDKVILSSYFLIASSIGVLVGFRKAWGTTRKIGLFAIYYSLGKFFIYDFYTQDFSDVVRMVTYFLLGFILLGISFLYAYLEKKYGDLTT